MTLHIGVDKGAPDGDMSAAVLTETQPDGTRRILAIRYGPEAEAYINRRLSWHRLTAWLRGRARLRDVWPRPAR